MAKPSVESFKVQGTKLLWKSKGSGELRELVELRSKDDAYKLAVFLNGLVVPQPKKVEDENLPNQMTMF